MSKKIYHRYDLEETRFTSEKFKEFKSKLNKIIS
jgi:hypothetical protein